VSPASLPPDKFVSSSCWYNWFSTQSFPILTEVFRRFPQSCQTDTRIVPSENPSITLFPTTFQILNAYSFCMTLLICAVSIVSLNRLRETQFYPKDGGSMFLRNVGVYLPYYIWIKQLLQSLWELQAALFVKLTLLFSRQLINRN
jgi:hypothetical protein